MMEPWEDKAPSWFREVTGGLHYTSVVKTVSRPLFEGCSLFQESTAFLLGLVSDKLDSVKTTTAGISL